MDENPTFEEQLQSLQPLILESVLTSVVRRRRRFSRPRLTNDDGTPTLWWAFIAIVVPALFVLSVITAAIVQQ
jgi:hypothetical protein